MRKRILGWVPIVSDAVAVPDFTGIAMNEQVRANPAIILGVGDRIWTFATAGGPRPSPATSTARR
jgi:hypothetical protein